MSLLVEQPFLPLLLTEPVYLLPEPESVPVLTPPVIQKEIPPAPKTSPVLNAPVVERAPSPTPSRKVSGNKVAILYNEQTTPYLQSQHESLLKNILKAVNLTLEEVDLINLNNIRQVDYVDILREKQLHYFLSFGIDLRELKLNIPLIAYQATEVEGVKMLLADSFHELELNLDKKRLLWACLKQLFPR